MPEKPNGAKAPPEPYVKPYITASIPQACYAKYCEHEPIHVVGVVLKKCHFHMPDSEKLRSDLLDLEQGRALVEPNRYGRILAALHRTIAEELRAFERDEYRRMGAARGWDQIRALQSEMELRAAEDRAASLSQRAERWISSTEHITTENPDDAA